MTAASRTIQHVRADGRFSRKFREALSMAIARQSMFLGLHEAVERTVDFHTRVGRVPTIRLPDNDLAELLVLLHAREPYHPLPSADGATS